MTTSHSPHLDCLPLPPYGPQDAPPAYGGIVGGREKVARRASFQLFLSAHRTLCPSRHFEGRNAA